MRSRFFRQWRAGVISLLCVSALSFSACSHVFEGDEPPDPAPISPAAAEAITPGVYEEPINVWLREEYSEGIGQSWEMKGSIMGVSADGTIIAVQEEGSQDATHGDWVGLDIRNGEEKWRNSTESKNIRIENIEPRQGVLFGQSQGEKENTLYFIDLSNGSAQKIGAYDSEKYYLDRILGVQHGLTYVQFLIEGTSGIDYRSGVHRIIAFKDGQPVWTIEAGKRPFCDLADGALVCYGGEKTGETGRIDIYNSATGERAAEIQRDFTKVVVDRDTIAVQSDSNGDAALWSLKGEEKGSGPIAAAQYWPQIKFGYETTKTIVDLDARVVNVAGQPLLAGKGNVGDSTTLRPVPIPEDADVSDDFYSTESGEWNIWSHHREGSGFENYVINAQGNTTPLGISGRVFVQGGILCTSSKDETITVYPPQGL